MILKQFERLFNKHLTQKTDYQPLFLCYFNIYFGKVLGRHQLSKLTHLLWLSYFIGATLMSVVMLATHQVDFIWQTSILSSEAFEALTNLLAYLPQQLGLSVPSIEQIQQSNVLTDNLLDAEDRRLAWSSLLISSLFLYGLLPRLALFLVMSQSLKKKKATYQLDLSDAYYVRLRQILKPNKTVLGVTDPDNEEKLVKHQTQPVHLSSENDFLTTEHYPIAIELSLVQLDFAKQHLQVQGSEFVSELINACDRQSQQSAISALADHKGHEIALYVSMSRLPDRGLKRFISELTSLSTAQFKLFMIIENEHHQQRDNDWYQLAKNVGIELDNIIHIEVGDIKHE
ncbi:DUF2868 domain-containing protein [Psychromonas sp. KJ10-10]|uniref:DUF2868 domain-containing protein n=1 Tax=Psychromonas sp. KJ10-10 TaxID=3391823 RepID=UPI0039B43581